MSDIDAVVAFLTACRDKEVRTASAATPGPWKWENEEFRGEYGSCPHEDEWTDHGPDLVTVAEEEDHLVDGTVVMVPVETVISSYGHDANGIIVGRADAAHVARQDPSSVLLRIDAERELVTTYLEKRLALDALFNGTQTYTVDEDARDVIEAQGHGEVDGLELAVQALAWGRRDRDGFNPAWFDSGFGPL